jgi:predicted dehydrogenase
MTGFRFAAIGINHDHINGLMRCMLAAGGTCAGFHAAEDDLAAVFAARYPGVPRLRDRRALLEASDIQLVVSAAIPGDRAALGVEAMRHGKDVLVDKPGALTLEELAELRAVQAETGRFYTIFYSEHLEQPSTVRAGELVAAGAIGQVVNTMGLGPHRMRRATRPDWFFDRRRGGAILADIASHQCEQFLFFAGAEDAEVLSATVGNHRLPDLPQFQDVGDIHLRAGGVTGYIRVDWYTPEALPVWGDGRLVILGTEGTIELRKYIDLAGRPGGNHLLLSNQGGVRHIDCSQVALPFGPRYAADLRDRTETAIAQAHVFKAMELALTAQAMADRAFVPAGRQGELQHGAV